MQFDRNLLPTLGVTWNYFPTAREAIAFAKWADRETADDNYPCEVFVTYDSDRGYEVKARNW